MHTGSFNNPLSSTCISYLTKTVAMLNWMHMHHFPLVFKAVHMNQLAWPLGDTTQSARAICVEIVSTAYGQWAVIMCINQRYFSYDLLLCAFLFFRFLGPQLHYWSGLSLMHGCASEFFFQLKQKLCGLTMLLSSIYFSLMFRIGPWSKYSRNSLSECQVKRYYMVVHNLANR